MDLGGLAGIGGRDLDGGLVRFDLEQALILGDLVTLFDEDLNDLGFGGPLAKIRKTEFA